MKTKNLVTRFEEGLETMTRYLAASEVLRRLQSRESSREAGTLLRGMRQAEDGEVHDLGSFASYVDHND